MKGITDLTQQNSFLTYKLLLIVINEENPTLKLLSFSSLNGVNGEVFIRTLNDKVLQ